MFHIKTKYNSIMAIVTPFITTLVVLSLLLAGAVLLKWINVENPTGLGYFLLAQAITVMVHQFNKKEY